MRAHVTWVTTTLAVSLNSAAKKAIHNHLSQRFKDPGLKLRNCSLRDDSRVPDTHWGREGGRQGEAELGERRRFSLSKIASGENGIRRRRAGRKPAAAAAAARDVRDD